MKLFSSALCWNIWKGRHIMSKKAKPSGSYPRQQPNYPTQQPAYPTHPYSAQQTLPPGSYQGNPVYGHNPGTSQYGEPPPPYTMTSQGQHYPTMPPVTSGYNQPPVPQMYTQSHAGAPSFMQPIQVTGSFDPGARFGAGATANIPPPPPGVAPTHAQMAAVQGQNVVMQQRQAGWFEGGPGGGTTFW